MTSTTLPINKILTGPALDQLKELPDESVQCCVTSPPYYGLRNYGVEGQIGLEATPEEYVNQLVGVFREVRRVLRSDGTVWLNLGDSYTSGNRASRGVNPKNQARTMSYRAKTPNGLKPKDLIGIPWMVAFALRADGWFLRSDIIWSKPNPLPESVKDRPTRSHEYIFLLSKSDRYYYNPDAIKERAIYGISGTAGKVRESKAKGSFAAKGEPLPGQLPFRAVTEFRNKRSVWSVTTKPLAEAHFATFPEELILPCIRAGSKHGDLVLDPFMGAGTTALVAFKQGRNFLGTEINPEYVALAYKRLRQAGYPSLFNAVTV